MFHVSRSRFLGRWVPAFFSLALVATVAACGSSSGDGAAGSGPLIVGSDAAYPPFESQTEDGFEGFDIDLFRAAGEAAGFEVEFQNMGFDALIPALQSNTIDAAISAMTITEERAEVVDFSQPYFKAGLAIAVQEDNADISSLEDLEGKKIAVQIGTTGADTANAIEGAEVVTFETAPIALQELSNKNVDAVINDAPVTLDAIATGNVKGIKVVGELLTEEFYGIAFPKDSENVAQVNEGLNAIIADGTYAEIYQKWFGAEPPALPDSAL